jgi:hypothetical protein
MRVAPGFTLLYPLLMNLTLRAAKLSAGLLALGICVSAAQAGLIHRFSFKDGAAKDSVGSVDGKLKGAGASIVEGRLVLKNDDSANGDKISCLEFAGSLLPKGGTTVSFALWFTAKDTSGFARLLNFGDSEGTEGKQFIYLSPKTGDGSARAAITGSDVGSKTALDFDALDDGKPHMVAMVIDGAAKKLRVFVDGAEPKPAEALGDNTLDKVKPVENWLGKSSFAADPGLSASIDELRVYDHALTADEAAAAFKAGPDALPAAPPAK